MAVLFRINAQSEAFEEALTAAGIPYVVRGAARFFERQEVRQALALLRGEARAGEEAADGLVDRVRAVLSGMGWSPEAPTARGQARDRWESLQALVSQADRPTRPTRGPAPTLAGFVAELDRRAHEQHAPVAEGVTLATLHAAKGLEWDAVFLCGMQEGSMPITYADTPAAVEEERRLLYVGITRAREHLWVSWALARNPGGQARRKPSRFLAGLRPESVTDRADAASAGPGAGAARRQPCASSARSRWPARASATAATAATARCPTTRSCSSRCAAWRKEQAEAQSVPAFVVFSDATLEALAEVKPTRPAGAAVDQRHRHGQAREVRRRLARVFAAELRTHDASKATRISRNSHKSFARPNRRGVPCLSPEPRASRPWQGPAHDDEGGAT